MSKIYQRKYLNLKALDVDTKNRKVKVAIAELESIDRDNEVFSPTAFDKTIAEKGPRGTNEIWHLADHTKALTSALGKFSELQRDGKYISGVSDYKDTWLWREVAWPLYDAGDITQHSVGFTTLNEAKSGSHTVLTEVALWEGSAVLWGANPNTPTQEVLKTFLESQKDSAEDRYDWVLKSLKEGKYSGEKESLLYIELLQLKQLFIDRPKETSPTDSEPKETSLELKEQELPTLLLLANRKFNLR